MSTYEEPWGFGRGRLGPRTIRGLPSDEWIAAQLSIAVKISSRFETGFELPAAIPAWPVEMWPNHRLWDLPPVLRSPARSARGAEEKILSILLDAHFRRGSAAGLAPFLPVFREKIGAAVRCGRPIEIVLPTLPFKCRSPLALPRRASAIDLGEWLHFSHLRDLCASIEAVHAPGARIILLADGLVYLDIVGDGDAAEAIRYRERAAAIRDRMGLGGHVEILDMQWLVRSEPDFVQVRSSVEAALGRLVEHSRDVRDRIMSLRLGMLVNTAFPDHDFASFSALLRGGTIPMEIGDRVNAAASAYAAFLLTMSWLEIVGRAFPRSIRGTVHPKPAAQLPLHLVNGRSTVFPHNGVPKVSRDQFGKTGDLRRATRIVKFHEAISRPGITAVHMDGEDAPFFFVD